MGSISILPSMYQSTIFGTSVRPRAPPKAVPFQTRPVTSWKGRVRDLLAGTGHADDDRLAPAAVGAFQRVAHHLDVAGAVEGVVRAADLVEGFVMSTMGDQIALDLCGLTKWVMPNRSPHSSLVVVDVDADDHVGPGHPQALDHVQPDAAQAEDHGLGPDLDLGGVDHRADAGGHAAADVADLVEGRVLAHLGQRDFGQDGVVGEGRAAHVVMHHRAIEENREVPSGIRPWPCVARIAVQRLVLRDRQDGHSRHSGV